MRRTRRTNSAGKAPAAPPTGSRVWLDYFGTPVPAMVLEDRGKVGEAGRHLLRVRLVDKDMLGDGDEQGSGFEVALDEVTTVKRNGMAPHASPRGGRSRGKGRRA